MKTFIAGRWTDQGQAIEVRNPYDDSLIDTVPRATAVDVEAALAASVRGAAAMRQLSGYQRYEILRRAATLMRERESLLAHTLSSEEGKLLGEATTEVRRATETIQLSAEEAKRLRGETLPLDGASNGAGKLGFTLRVPCGVVAAITPFNFPLNLPCHKVGPALAAGNAVIFKPASDTPLSAILLVEILLEAGLPELAISCLIGPGKEVATPLCRDSRVRKVSFTGSRDVGQAITEVAGIKRVTLELGSNSPLVVLADADLEAAAAAIVATGYSNAGQTCISAQRILVERPAYDELIDRLKPQVADLAVGDQFDTGSKMGPMIRAADAERVASWIDEAKSQGASVVAGGKRQGARHEATLVVGATPSMKICHDELFGPAVAVTAVDNLEAAITLANDSNYGLSAAIFTRDLSSAMRFAQRVESGNIHLNYGPGWRADLMPYGGLKESGLGKEGPAYAIVEMTELKTVVVHGLGDE